LGPAETVHGVLVCVDGTGVLITGEAGAGKSALALALIYAGHRLVADDVVKIRQDGDRLFGHSPAGFEKLIEVRGLGILDITKVCSPGSFLSECSIDICIHLEAEYAVRVHADQEHTEILGVAIPRFGLSIARSQNGNAFVETAVKLFRDPGIRSIPEIVSE
jgi:HPr kinase/phosphorylase